MFFITKKESFRNQYEPNLTCLLIIGICMVSLLLIISDLHELVVLLKNFLTLPLFIITKKMKFALSTTPTSMTYPNLVLEFNPIRISNYSEISSSSREPYKFMQATKQRKPFILVIKFIQIKFIIKSKNKTFFFSSMRA